MQPLEDKANAIQRLTTQIWQGAQKRAQESPTVPRIHQPRFRLKLIQIAYEDAAYLATLFLGNQSISRSACNEVGIKDPRRLRARTLLQMAQLLDPGDTGLNTVDLRKIKYCLANAYERAMEDPRAFFARVPVYDKRRKDYHKQNKKANQ